jgi:hypothetical protein
MINVPVNLFMVFIFRINGRGLIPSNLKMLGIGTDDRAPC